jgi:arylsulfatase A-like enzyme
MKPTKTHGIGLFLLMGSLLAVICGVAGHTSTSISSLPNIVLLIADQHNADALGCAGYSFVKTPALDSLASTGVRFRNTYCTYPVCMSSRASLMTGRWPHELKKIRADEKSERASEGKKKRNNEGKQANPPGVSLGSLMKEAGYQTAYFGKWHVGGVNSSADNPWHGFDIIEDGRHDVATADNAIRFMKAKHEGPYFVVVSFLNPHDICEWARMRSGIHDVMKNGEVSLEPPLAKCPPLPSNFEIPPDEPEIVGLRRNSAPQGAHPTLNWGPTEWRQYRWAYARLIEKADEQIGRLLDALKATGQQERTLVAYTSDHGDGNAGHHWNQKMVLYEEAVRIPLILSWPGHTIRGKVDTDHLVSMGLDILPTLVDYAGIEAPVELTGNSLRPWADLGYGNAPKEGRVYVVVEVEYNDLFPGEKGVQGLLCRSSGFTYLCYGYGKNPEQLFDVQADPGQTTNLVAHPKYQATLTQHRQWIREWVKETKSPFSPDKIP